MAFNIFEKLTSVSLRALRDDYEVYVSVYQAKADNCRDKIKEIDRILNERAARLPLIDAQPSDEHKSIVGPMK